MATTTDVFDSTGDAVFTADDQTVVGLGPLGTSFSNGSSAGTLSSVTLGLFDKTPADGGTLTVQLLSNASGNVPGTVLETLGTVADSKLGTTDTSTFTLSGFASYTLAAGTRYWIEVTGSSGSKALLAYSLTDGGTGVGSEYSFYQGASQPNSAGGANIAKVTVNTVCFCTGTRILTARGEVAVEELRAGDAAVTASGGRRPIVWIGHRDLGAPGRTLPFAQCPVRVLAGAFGPERPARTLYLSPGHPVLVGADEDGEGGRLVPIMCLVNGTTVEREERASVTYWHVELDAHDILLAEGLPAESYLDWGDRPFFTEGADHALANPDLMVPGLGARCRPVAVDGPVVEAERRRLDAVFAADLAAACAWPDAGDALGL